MNLYEHNWNRDLDTHQEYEEKEIGGEIESYPETVTYQESATIRKTRSEFFNNRQILNN